MVAPVLAGVPLAELMSLRHQVAVVTGAGRGIGRAIAERLAEAGSAVVVADLDADAAATTAEILSGKGVRAWASGVDVRDSARVEELANQTVEAFGRISTWVNGAGIYSMSPVWQIDDVTWDETLEINLRGTFVGCRAAARRMRETGGGVIVNLTSTAIFNGGPSGHCAYSASKAGVVAVTRNLAKELGPHGIRVFALAPGLIRTEGVELMRDNWRASGHVVDEGQVAAALPLGRTGHPDDVALVALFCASGLSSYMSGQTFVVDGGGAKV